MHNLLEPVLVRVTTVPQIFTMFKWSRIDLLAWLEQVGAILLEVLLNTDPDEINGYLDPLGSRLRRTSFGTEPVFVADRGGIS